MKTWKVKITYRDWYDIDTRTKVYCSSKQTCQDAIVDCIDTFYCENSDVSIQDIIGINAIEDIF